MAVYVWWVDKIVSVRLETCSMSGVSSCGHGTSLRERSREVHRRKSEV